MDPRVAGAGVAMTVGMLLLLPTFNALNNSYTTDVAPPAWLAKFIDPESLPDDFKPPEDVELPEDYEIPEDMELPPGWEPPPGYDGPIPPGGCEEPPLFDYELNDSGEMGFQWPGESFSFDVPQYAYAVLANVTFTNWQAQRVFGTLEVPGAEALEKDADGGAGGLLVPATTQSKSELLFHLEAKDEASIPPEGQYTFEIGAETAISGSWEVSVIIVLPCGGKLA